jgi:hypothetical protein
MYISRPAVCIVILGSGLMWFGRLKVSLQGFSGRTYQPFSASLTEKLFF